MTDIQTTLTEIIKQVMPEESQSITVVSSSRFVEDLAFDSLKSIMLATLVDDAFGLDLNANMGELLNLATVEEACQFINCIKG
ncbi:MAG: acyl carrier protein [Alteromonadaceae bacterium]|jgi:acyl carrier protein